MREELRDWHGDILLPRIQAALIKNNFNVIIAPNREAALQKAAELIPEGSLCGFGGSMSVAETGIKEMILKEYPNLNPYDPKLDNAGRLEIRRKTFATDWFITGSNGITEDGTLVNLDAYGNRVAALSFGPDKVLVVAGRNKIVSDLAAAEERIRAYTAPANNKRLGRKTPCVETGKCEDCNSPERICNCLSVIRKSCPAGRITVLLVNEDLGL